MVTRRVFLGWSGFVGVGVLAHHKPGHDHGHGHGTTTTTTVAPTTTTLAPTTTTSGGGVYADVYIDLYEVA
jgi:hypothetical protein